MTAVPCCCVANVDSVQVCDKTEQMFDYYFPGEINVVVVVAAALSEVDNDYFVVLLPDCPFANTWASYSVANVDACRNRLRYYAYRAIVAPGEHIVVVVATVAVVVVAASDLNAGSSDTDFGPSYVT